MSHNVNPSLTCYACKIWSLVMAFDAGTWTALAGRGVSTMTANAGVRSGLQSFLTTRTCRFTFNTSLHYGHASIAFFTTWQAPTQATELVDTRLRKPHRWFRTLRKQYSSKIGKDLTSTIAQQSRTQYREPSYRSSASHLEWAKQAPEAAHLPASI